jgi:hypothetical protein
MQSEGPRSQLNNYGPGTLRRGKVASCSTKTPMPSVPIHPIAVVQTNLRLQRP